MQVKRCAKISVLLLVAIHALFFIYWWLYSKTHHKAIVQSQKDVISRKSTISSNSSYSKYRRVQALVSSQPPSSATRTTQLAQQEQRAAGEPGGEPGDDPAQALADAHDAYCRTSGEWLKLTDSVFFKRSYSFYFVDLKRYRAYLLLALNYQVSIQLRFELFDAAGARLLEHRVEQAVRILPPWFVGEYGHAVLEAELDLGQLLRADRSNVSVNVNVNASQLTMRVHCVDTLSGRAASAPLDVVVKHLRGVPVSSRKRSAILCTKCFYSREADYKHFDWWLTLNRRIGYDRLVMCNSSIPDTAAFRAVFRRHAPFVRVVQLRCLPNFLDRRRDRSDEQSSDGAPRRPDYLQRYEQLGEALKMDVFSGIVINECYLTHVDQYRYVGIFDNDETVMPRQLSAVQTLEQNVAFVRAHVPSSDATDQQLSNHSLSIREAVDRLKCDRFTLPSASAVSAVSAAFPAQSADAPLMPRLGPPSTSQLELFLQNLNSENKLSSADTSYNFDQAFHIKYRVIDMLFDELDKRQAAPVTGDGHATLSSSQPSERIQMRIQIRTDSFDARYSLEPVNYIFTVSGARELDYANKLRTLYVQLVKPFLAEHAALLRDTCQKFDRLFVLIEKQADALYGKTIHNTNTTLDATLHQPYQSTYVKVPLRLAYLSHFRSTYQASRQPSPVPITRLQFDLNFFNCYFRPILTELASTWRPSTVRRGKRKRAPQSSVNK